MGANKTIILSIILLITLSSCEKEDKNPTLDDFCSVKPKNWDCSIVLKDFDKNEIPQNAPQPIGIIKYQNHNAEITGLSNTMVNPSLILDFYPINQKEALIDLIKSQQVYSWCIPIYYGETKDYFIVTSPCFINEGINTEQAESSLIELQKAINQIIEKKNYDLIQN